MKHKTPVLLACVDDESVRRALYDQLKTHFGERYEIRVEAHRRCTDFIAMCQVEAIPLPLVIATHPFAGIPVDPYLAQVQAEYPDALKLFLTHPTKTGTPAMMFYHHLTIPWQPFDLKLLVARALHRHQRVTETIRRQPPLSDTEAQDIARLQQQVEALQQQQQTLEQVNKQLRQQFSEMSLVNAVFRAVSNVADLDTALEVIARVMTYFLDAHGVAIAVHEPETDVMRTVAHYDRGGGSSIKGEVFRLDTNPIAHQALYEGQSVLIEAPATSDLLSPEVRQIFKERGIHSVINVPLFDMEQAIGTLAIALNDPDRSFTTADIKSAEMLARQLGGTIDTLTRFQTEQAQRKLVEKLQRATTHLNRSLEPRTVLTEILQQLRRVVAYDSAGIFLHKDDHLVLYDGTDLEKDVIGYRLSLSDRDPAVQVFNSGDSLIIEDVNSELDWVWWEDGHFKMRAWMGTPLACDGEVIGVLTVDSHEVAAFETEHLRSMAMFAEPAALALKNAQRFEVEQRMLRQSEQLYAAALALNATRDHQQVWEVILHELQKVVPFDSATVQEYKDGLMHVVYGTGFPNIEDLMGVAFSQEDTWRLSQQVVNAKKPIILDDVQDHPAFQVEPNSQFNIRSWMGVPLMLGEKVIGKITLDKQKPNFYTPEHARVAMAFAAQAALTLENAQLLAQERQQRLLAEEQNKELDAFAHTVAHNLKNPLGVVAGYIDYMKSYIDTVTRAEVAEHLESIHRAAYKASNIVDELLLLARVRKQDVPVTAVDTAAVVARALQRLALMIEDYDATLVVPEQWPTVIGYAPWLEEVWINYLSNGIKYGGEPPHLTLGATPASETETRFWVKDNGSGLSEAAHEVLFTEFTRLREVGEGHGLGLSIVQRIISKLGGQVGVEHEMDGSRFYFTLPNA